MDWDQIKVFLEVLRKGSVRQAAKSLGTTHATVARQLRKLESDLKEPLFQNTRPGRELTALGHRLLPLAQSMEESAIAIERAAFAEDTGLAGIVRLSVSESLYVSLLHGAIDSFLIRYPMIELDLLISDNLSSLNNREADVVIRITQTPPDSAIGRKLADSPLCPYVSQSYLDNRPTLDRWVALDYRPSKEPVLPARTVATVSSAIAAARMVRDGRGIALLPCYQGDPDPELVRLPGFAPQADMEVWVLTHTDVRTNPRVRVLMDHLYGLFGEISRVIEGQTT